MSRVMQKSMTAVTVQGGQSLHWRKAFRPSRPFHFSTESCRKMLILVKQKCVLSIHIRLMMCASLAVKEDAQRACHGNQHGSEIHHGAHE